MTDTSLVICQCGYTCRKLPSAPAIHNGNADIADYSDIRAGKPKWLKFNDGHRERYDPTKHGMKKGAESHRDKKTKTKKAK